MKKKILCSVLGALLLFIVYFLWFSPYPEFKAFKNQEYSASIYDRNGCLIQVTTLEEGLRREWTPINQIPKNVKKIFIKAEDKRFYFHKGFDLFSAMGAAIQNTRAGRTVRGASTISMQLAKIIDANYSKSKNGDRPLLKKLLDITNAFRLEARLTKKQILEMYLNSVPFGMNTEGVTSAARSFFGLELNQLSEDQIKCLSVIPRRPSLYNPINNPEECAQRSGVDLKVANQAKLYEYPFYMPHYVNYLKTQGLQRGKVVTSIDLALQQNAEKYLRTAMQEARGARISNGAVLLLDNKTGKVLVWIGNNNWYDTEHHGQMDGVLARNQPGSSMKPFLYAMALDHQENNKPIYYPSKVLADVQKEFGSQQLYIPANFNNQFNGPVRFRIALASSLNIPAVQLLSDLGVDNYLEKLDELGFESLRFTGKKADLGLALGAGEVSLKELVTAFSVFARDGKDFSGNQIYTSDTARLICSILSDSNSRALGFGYTQTFKTDYPSIFKTGTANQYQNIVALGSTTEYTVGVWMGNFEGQTVVGKTGSSLPAYVARQLLDLLEKNKDYKQLEFYAPENWRKEKLCSLSGLPAGRNCPATISDYLWENHDLKECNWHKSINGEVFVEYPAEYQSWMIKNKVDGVLNHKDIPLTIVSPQDDSLFYLSEVNSKFQQIRVELIGGSQNEITVMYDDELLQPITRPFVFYLPVEEGEHNFTVQCGAERVSQSYTVK